MKKYTAKTVTKHSIKMAIQEEIDMCRAVIKSQPKYADDALRALKIAETAMKMPAKKAVKYILTANK